MKYKGDSEESPFALTAKHRYVLHAKETINEMKTIERFTNQVLNGDCIELIKQMPDDSIDLIVFSPPYDSIRDYKKNWSFDYLKLGKELHRVTKDGGVAVVVIGDSTKRDSCVKRKPSKKWNL